MAKNVAYSNEKRMAEILRELTELSNAMNDAILHKDAAKIEQVHIRKKELIERLNLMVIAQSGEQRK